MNKSIAIVVVLAALTGCTTFTEPEAIGQGRYLVTTLARGGMSSDGELKGMALQKARAYCGTKEMVLESWSSNGLQGWTPRNSEVIFHCEAKK